MGLDLVEEGRQLALERGVADFDRAIVGQLVEFDRRRQQRRVARDHGDEIGRLAFGRLARIVAVHRADLELGLARFFEVAGESRDRARKRWRWRRDRRNRRRSP